MKFQKPNFLTVNCSWQRGCLTRNWIMNLTERRRLGGRNGIISLTFVLMSVQGGSINQSATRWRGSWRHKPKGAWKHGWFGTKTEYVQINFYVLWCSLFKPLNVQFYSNSLIQMWSSITLWRTNVFTLFPKQFFFGLVESSENSESGPISLPIIDIPKKPLAS